MPKWLRKPAPSRRDWIAELERQLGRTENEVIRGQLAGLTSDEIRLPRLDGEMSNQYRAGFLTGRLFARLFEQRGRVDVGLLMAATPYAATLAAEGKLEDPSPETLVRQHNVGCIYLTRKGKQVSEEDELLMFRWLADELGIAVTKELLARYEQIRGRRIARLATD